MADIHVELQNILKAVYGEEVRGSIYDAIFKINKEVEKGGGGGGGGVDSVARKTATDALSKANANEISINDLKTSTDELSEKTGKISKKANTNEKDITALKTRMTNAETRIDDIQEYIDSGGGSGGEAGVDTEARRTASEALSKANANEADIAEYKPKVDDLITDLATASSNASEALTKATTNRTTLSTLGGKVDTLQTTVNGHSDTLTLHERTLDIYNGLFKAIDKRRHSVSVKEFDAKGDGVTDDTVAIQTAINEAHAQGMDVFIPAGTYLLATELYEAKNGDTSACLHMYSNMKIYGERNTVLKAGTSVDHIIFNEVNDNATGYSGGSSMILDTLIFDGNANRTTPITPINFSHSRDIIIRNVQVRNIPAGVRNGVDAWWHAIEINGCRNVHIENCIFRDNVYCSEIIQLDHCMGGGNLGTNDYTPCYAIFIHDCHFVCRGGRAVGNHSDIKLYNNQQKWHEYIYIYNNHIEGRCHGGSNDPTKTAANGRGFIRFEYHTRRLSIFNNVFKRSLYISGDSSVSSLPENNGGRTYYGIIICRTYKRDGVESDPRPASFDIDIHDNQFFSIFKSVENPMLFNVHDNTNEGVVETGTVEKLRSDTAFDVPPQTDEYDGMYFDEQNRSEGQLWFKFGAGLRVTANGYFNASYGYREEYIRLALTWDQIIASMRESYSGLTVASHDGYANCVQVPNDATVVFDYADKKVKLITGESTPNGSGGTTWTSDSVAGTQVVLFTNRYGNAVNMHRSLSHLWSNIQLRKMAGGGGISLSGSSSVWSTVSQTTFFKTQGTANIIEYHVLVKDDIVSGFIKFENITTASNGIYAFPGYAVRSEYRGPTNIPIAAALHIGSAYEAATGYINSSDGGIRIVNAAGSAKTYSQASLHFAYSIARRGRGAVGVYNVLGLGDSICSGGRNSNKGFVGDLGMPYKNIGISGAAMGTTASGTVKTIPQQLLDFYNSNDSFKPDIIIANGGTNDYWKNGPLGTLSTTPKTSTSGLDTSTFLGGLEILFIRMITLFPKAQRFFVTTHKIKHDGAYWPTTANAPSTGSGYTTDKQHQLIVDACKLYNVNLIDIYENGMINTLFSPYVSPTPYSSDPSITNTQYVDKDGIHPCAYGYQECYAPLISEAIRIGTAK